MINFLFSQIKLNLKHITLDHIQSLYIDTRFWDSGSLEPETHNIIDDYIKNVWLYNTLFSTIFSRAIDKHLINSTGSRPSTNIETPATEINKILVRQEWLQYENQKLLFEHIKNAHIEIQQLKKDVSRLSQLFLEQIYNENNFDNNLN